MNSKITNTKIKSLNKIESNINKKLKQKYLSIEYTYNHQCGNYLLYNEKSRVVAIYKDYLILDDSTEFLRRFYSKIESKPRLNRILTFYENYSKIFPNYMILPESEYLYKNIRRKQKMIDAVNEIKKEEEENRRLIGGEKKYLKNKDNIEVFTKDINDDIQNYNPSETRDFDDNSFNNSISISYLSKKFIPNNENSFTNENKNNCNIVNETNLSIEKILNIMNTSKIYTDELKQGILIEEDIKKQKQIDKENQFLISPKKSKKYISKIINSQNHISLNPKDILTNIASPTYNHIHKLLSNLNSGNNDKNYNIINNYQNIIIPKGNTIININNNYYQYDSNKNNFNNKHLNAFTPHLKKNHKTINIESSTNSNKKTITSPIYHKIPSQLKIIDNNNQRKQTIMSPQIVKKYEFELKSPSKTNITTPKNNNLFSERINTSVKQCKSTKGIYEQNLNINKNKSKNYNLYGSIYQMKKEEKKTTNKKPKKLKIKQIYKKVNKTKKEKENILYSPKNIDLQNKSPFSELKKKHKNYIKKAQGSSYISKRNSCDNFLLETKSKKNFKEKYGYTIKKNNAFTPNKSTLTQNKNDSTITSQKSILMSPKVDYSNTRINCNDSSYLSPVPIRVNRKFFLENLKKKQNMKNLKSSSKTNIKK